MRGSSWILRLCHEWTRRPMTDDEVGNLAMYLDHVDAALREAQLAFRLTEGHSSTFRDALAAAESRAPAVVTEEVLRNAVRTLPDGRFGRTRRRSR